MTLAKQKVEQKDEQKTWTFEEFFDADAQVEATINNIADQLTAMRNKYRGNPVLEDKVRRYSNLLNALGKK